MSYINNVSTDVSSFLQSFEDLFPPEKLTFLGILFDRIYTGMINSEDKANSFEVSDDGYILTPDELCIDGCGDIAFELVHKANDYFGGSFPHCEFIDCLETWITHTLSLDETEGRFNMLSFRDKLYALAELFCCIGDGNIGVNLNGFDLDGYWIAHRLLDLIAELFPSECESKDLPF